MKKSTMLIVLLGVLVFGLAGNLFGQDAYYDENSYGIFGPQPEINWSQDHEGLGDQYFLIQAVIHVRSYSSTDGSLVPLTGATVTICKDDDTSFSAISDDNGEIHFADMVSYDGNSANQYFFYLAPNYFFEEGSYYPYLTWNNNYEGTLIAVRCN